MTTSKPAPNVSLQKKSAARIAAVQCLYTLSFNDRAPSIAKQVAQLKDRLANNASEQKLVVGMALEPNYKLTESLLEGIIENREEIDIRLDSVLSNEWKRERMSPVLIAIMQCAIYELFFGKEIKPAIVLDEYARITRSFFADAEVDFMYGALSALVERFG